MSKITWCGIIFIIAGIVSAILERIFYGGRFDENNVMQDSFFLPLTFILGFLGIAVILFAVIRNLLQRAKSAS